MQEVVLRGPGVRALGRRSDEGRLGIQPPRQSLGGDVHNRRAGVNRKWES